MPGTAMMVQTNQGQMLSRQSIIMQPPMSMQPVSGPKHIMLTGQSNSGHAMPMQPINGHMLPGQSNSGQTMPMQHMQGQLLPGQLIPGQYMPMQQMQGQQLSVQPTPGQLGSAQPIPRHNAVNTRYPNTNMGVPAADKCSPNQLQRRDGDPSNGRYVSRQVVAVQMSPTAGFSPVTSQQKQSFSSSQMKSDTRASYRDMTPYPDPNQRYVNSETNGGTRQPQAWREESFEQVRMHIINDYNRDDI